MDKTVDMLIKSVFFTIYMAYSVDIHAQLCSMDSQNRIEQGGVDQENILLGRRFLNKLFLSWLVFINLK